MLSLLISVTLCTRFIGIDLGSQFFKTAESTSSGAVQVFMHPSLRSVNYPSAVAVKLLNPNTTLQTERDFEDIDVRFGSAAQSLLKKNRSLGYEFPVRVIGRSGSSEFRTSQIAFEFELFMLTLHNLVVSDGTFEALALAIPTYFVRGQLSVISEACRRWQLPLIDFVTDSDAVMTAYATLRPGRFRNASRHVLFVDVGATSAKVYSAQFAYVKASPLDERVEVKQTSGEWSEQVGGYFFARAVAIAQNRSLSKATKALLRNSGEGYADAVDAELDELEHVIGAALEQAEAAGPIDEVQLIGGGSTFKFVVETVKRATNRSIRRDFNANEAVALGTAIVAMQESDASPYVRVHTAYLSPADFNIICGNASFPMCVKGEPYKPYVIASDIPAICPTFQVHADPHHIPEGINPHIMTYNATHITALDGEGNFTAKFLLGGREHVRAVQFCNADGKCVDDEVEGTPPMNTAEIENGFTFVVQAMAAKGNRDNRNLIITKHTKLSALRAKIDQGKVDPTHPMTAEMEEELGKLTEIIENDGLATFDSHALREWNKKLDEMVNKMQIKI